MSRNHLRTYFLVISLLNLVSNQVYSQAPHPHYLASVRSFDSKHFDELTAKDWQDTAPSRESIRRLTREAYVWGWPMVYLYNCRNSLSNLPTSGVMGGTPVAPPNSLSMLTDVISPGAAMVACPNQDVVYGFGVLDFSQDSAVLQIPDFGDRFWLIQLGDQRTDAFAQVGAMYGTKPGLYLLVGPQWEGEIPEGFEAVLRCPTELGYCLPRVFIRDTEEDREAVQ